MVESTLAFVLFKICFRRIFNAKIKSIEMEQCSIHVSLSNLSRDVLVQLCHWISMSAQ